MEKHELKLQLTEDQVDQILLGLTLRQDQLRRHTASEYKAVYGEIIKSIDDIKRQIVEDNREPSLWVGATANGNSIIDCRKLLQRS